ncbi:hypothetical protein [Paraburkholderia dilworthii]|uniref:Uncharacterized protein n=1 Tax=Paraburkholderia dilworthii TaxID=948106 RepID=A0ABW9DED1_9BURK
MATPLNVGVIQNYKSYWATHFYAVLQCLHSHRTLNYTPTALAYYPSWKLRDLRADLPFNFFHQIESYLQNWGFQYFMSVFLNYKMSSDIVDQLIGRLSRLYNIQLLNRHIGYRFFLAGSDSILSEGLLDEFTEVFPLQLNGNRSNAQHLAQQSDLCLVLSFPIPYARLAIFGEVEGLHGHSLSNESYWKEKLPFCVITIGVIEGAGKNVYISDTFINNIPRVNLVFERKHPVVQDFLKVLNFMRVLFSEGGGTKMRSGDEEFDFFFNKVRQHWDKNTVELIDDLRTYCNDGELMGVAPKPIAIITDIQA